MQNVRVCRRSCLHMYESNILKHVSLQKQEHLAIIDNLSKENHELKLALNDVNQGQSHNASFDEVGISIKCTQLAILE